jgi:hypothetical protein
LVQKKQKKTNKKTDNGKILSICIYNKKKTPRITAICIQAQTANIFARFFTFETERLPLETEMYSPLM